MAITAVGFDADDTLWHSETYFAVTEDRFRALVAPWSEEDDAAAALVAAERRNLAHFGYGVKGFTLSMIETAIEVSDGAIPTGAIAEIVEWGREMMSHPVELIDGVEAVLDQLADRRLLLLTKGDLWHQESKIAESGLADRFEIVEVMNEKDPDGYRRVLTRAGIDPVEFVMVGNSLRSDIEPVVAIGARAIHVPYRLTWALEDIGADEISVSADGGDWQFAGSIAEVPTRLDQLST